MAGTSISNRLVPPISAEDLNMILLNSFSNEKESLSLALCGTYASFNITDCLFELLFSGLKLDSGGVAGGSVGLFLILSCDFSVFFHDILLILVLSISIGFKIPNTVALGM